VANKRIFYAVYQMGFSKLGENNFTSAHGVQTVGVNTKFNLEQIFEVGQISIYQQVENIPDIEITCSKVLDGYPLLYHLATKGAASASLSGRSNIKSTVGLSIYSDSQDSASGTPISQCYISGVFVSALNYTFPVDGNFTEELTLIGNNKIWTKSFTATAFNNTDSPLAYASGLGGVQRRQDLIYYPLTAGGRFTILPLDIPGITSSGTNELQSDGNYAAHLQSIRVQSNLNRTALLELGRRGPYHRYVPFPVEVTCDIEVLDINGDQVQALENALANLTQQQITICSRDGTYIDLGVKNKLDSVNWGGATAQQGGGNATATYAYRTFNDLTVTHPQDPSGL
jgi:hypothetical protein